MEMRSINSSNKVLILVVFIFTYSIFILKISTFYLLFKFCMFLFNECMNPVCHSLVRLRSVRFWKNVHNKKRGLASGTIFVKCRCHNKMILVVKNRKTENDTSHN